MKTQYKVWPFISVIVVNLNGKKWLGRCFKSVLASNYPRDRFEVILVDNGSVDGSVEFVRDVFSEDTRISAVSNEKNLGWSPANNQGMKLAKGEILVCLSNDMEVDPEWLKEIVLAMKSSSSVGVVQCNSISMQDRKTPDSAMNYLDKFGYSYGYSPTSSEPQEVFFAEGMAFAVTRKVIDEIGMLDDYYFMEYDDMDFSWRARLAGYRVLFAPSAEVYHARGATVGATYFQRLPNVTLYVRNHFITLMKNYEFGKLLTVLPVVTAIEMAKIAFFYVKGERKTANANLNGLFQVVRDMGSIPRKRKNVQRLRKVSDAAIMELMHSFSPRLLFRFIASQARGQRFILNSSPPVRSN